MNKQQIARIKVLRVANGFEVTTDLMNDGTAGAFDDIFVFNTDEDLFAWMRANIGDASRKNQVEQ